MNVADDFEGDFEDSSYIFDIFKRDHVKLFYDISIIHNMCLWL